MISAGIERKFRCVCAFLPDGMITVGDFPDGERQWVSLDHVSCVDASPTGVNMADRRHMALIAVELCVRYDLARIHPGATGFRVRYLWPFLNDRHAVEVVMLGRPRTILRERGDRVWLDALR